MALTEESSQSEVERDVRAKTETLTRQKSGEVPSRAARGNALSRAISSGRSLTVSIERPIVHRWAVGTKRTRLSQAGWYRGHSLPSLLGREVFVIIYTAEKY